VQNKESEEKRGRFLRDSREIEKTAVICGSVFLVAFGMGIKILGSVFYIREIFSASPSQIGFFNATWSCTYILSCLLLRPLYNRAVPRSSMIVSSSFMGAALLGMVSIRAFALTFVFHGLYGIAEAVFWPTSMGWLSAGIEGARLGRRMSVFNLSWSTGLIVSPLVAGVLSTVSPSLPLSVGSGVLFTASVLICGAGAFIPHLRSHAKVKTGTKDESRASGANTKLRYPAWIGLFTTYVVIGILFSVFPVYALEELGVGKGLIGFLLQIRALCATIGFVVLGRTDTWHFRPGQMLAGQFVQACAVLLLSFSGSPLWIAVLIAFIGFAMSLSYFNSLFHAVSGSVDRAARMAIHEAVLSAGLIAGSSVGGVVYEHSSMTSVYVICAALLLAGIAAQAVSSSGCFGARN
jgi:MFS family permease